MEFSSLTHFTYFAYLALAFAGTLALQFFFRIRIPLREACIAIFVSGVFFVLWDVLAVAAGHWAFGLSHMLGWRVGNQPVEEIAFFIIIPLFGIMLWELFGKSPHEAGKTSRRRG